MPTKPQRMESVPTFLAPVSLEDGRVALPLTSPQLRMTLNSVLMPTGTTLSTLAYVGGIEELDESLMFRVKPRVPIHLQEVESKLAVRLMLGS